MMPRVALLALSPDSATVTVKDREKIVHTEQVASTFVAHYPGDTPIAQAFCRAEKWAREDGFTAYKYGRTS